MLYFEDTARVASVTDIDVLTVPRRTGKLTVPEWPVTRSRLFISRAESRSSEVFVVLAVPRQAHLRHHIQGLLTRNPVSL